MMITCCPFGGIVIVPYLAKFGRVTGTDLSDKVLARAQARMPHVKFVSGDFMEPDFGNETFMWLSLLRCCHTFALGAPELDQAFHSTFRARRL